MPPEEWASNESVRTSTPKRYLSRSAKANMAPAFVPIERFAAARQAAIQIREMVVSGNLQPGQALPPERDLAAQLHVSRSTLREAIRALELVNVLESRHGTGTFVTGLEPSLLVEPINILFDTHRSSLPDLSDARQILETGIARRRGITHNHAQSRSIEASYSKQQRRVVVGHGKGGVIVGAVEVTKVWKYFGTTPAVVDLNLDVADGSFVVLLGASGCGKTTSLRLLAGLEKPTDGEIRFDGAVVNDVPAGRRDVALVFQSYALYPHMTVYNNLTFGPRVRHENKAATHLRVLEVAERLGLADLLKRRPSQLSGGQRQRVAVARALLRNPTLFLMDEPLSNLDTALRADVRAELIRLHRQFNITTVYVTHDQTEAMSMADKIAVMGDGRLLQYGTPSEVYDRPVNLKVATFLGAPRMNVHSGRLRDDSPYLVVEVLGARIPLPSEISPERSGQHVLVGFRPSDVEVRPPELRGDHVVRGEVEFVEPMGGDTWVTVACGDERVVAHAPGRARLSPGANVALEIDPGYLYAFEPDTGNALLDRSALDTGRAGEKRLTINSNVQGIS
jgi:ABC-type sugar transport system ATPase subunit